MAEDDAKPKNFWELNQKMLSQCNVKFHGLVENIFGNIRALLQLKLDENEPYLHLETVRAKNFAIKDLAGDLLNSKDAKNGVEK